jgi:hypothetical protein
VSPTGRQVASTSVVVDHLIEGGEGAAVVVVVVVVIVVLAAGAVRRATNALLELTLGILAD